MKVLLILAAQASLYGAPSNDTAPRGLSPLPAAARFVFNANRPWGWNDGALWAGRGLSGALDGGVRWRYGGLTVTLAPTVWFATNGGFDTLSHTFADRHPLAYPYGTGIDLPQRLGDRGITRIAPGQSGIRFEWRRATVGLSTENIWWGPAQRHPILLGTSAEGFPHVDFGLRPAPMALGSVEGRVVWGRLTESAWFDTIPDNNHRLFAGLMGSWSPRWIPGLTVGFQRIFYQEWTDSLGADDWLAIIQPFTKQAFFDSTNPGGDDARDQMLSLTWRWDLAEAGLAAYGEWARNDHNVDWRDFIVQPDHAQAWMVGLERRWNAGSGAARMHAEVLHLSRSATVAFRATPTFYTHHIVRQGFTHKGQPLGAGVGPGSDAQFLAFDRSFTTGAWGLWAERIRWFADDGFRLHNRSTIGFRSALITTVEGGVRYERQVGRMRATTRLSLIREFNRNYQVGNNVWNVSVGMGARWDW